MDFKEGFDKNLKNTPAVDKNLLRIALEVYENCADNLRNNQRLREISIPILFQFYLNVNRKHK